MKYPELLNIKGIGKAYHQRIVSGMEREALTLEQIGQLTPEIVKKKLTIPIHIARLLVMTYAPQKQSTSKPDKKPQLQAKKLSSVPGVTAPITDRHFIIVTYEDDNYPASLKNMLGEKAPEKLYMWGNLSLLKQPGIGFCGSRNVTQKGLRITEDVCEQISEHRWVTISGHARGVDATAHRTALENNSGTIVVLPQGINGFKLRMELRKYAREDNILIISEFSPDAGWNVGYAMQRNATIIALSSAMVLVESRDTGGTFNAGQTALRLNHPLFVVRFQDTQASNAGNDYFIQRGAYQLMKSQSTNRANISTLVEKVQEVEVNGTSTVNEAPQQLPILFDTTT